MPGYRRRLWNRQWSRLVKIDLAREAYNKQNERLVFAETQLRQLCAQRNLDWDALSEEEREAFIDDLLHEK